MLRSINIAVNNTCNNKCGPCKIWSIASKNELDPDKLSDLLKTIDVSKVTDCSLTGGELFIHSQYDKLTDRILPLMPNLEMLFTNTTGLLEKRITEYVRKYEGRVPELYVCVSLEGEEAIHNQIRGVQSFRKVTQNLRNWSAEFRHSKEVHFIVSQTISDINQDISQLEYVRQMAQELGMQHSFRLANVSDVYYQNEGQKTEISQTFLDELSGFIRKNYPNDPFLPVLMEHAKTGTNSIMVKKGELLCRAGDTFVFIDYNGIVRPCIYSERSLCTIESPQPLRKLYDLGEKEPCPCCTECTIYPMLNCKE